jgi:c(7)-type cytochrome triheme protein
MKSIITGFVVVLFFFVGMLSDQSVYAQIKSDPQVAEELSPDFKGIRSPSNYGNIVLQRYADRFSQIYLKPVVFPHWFHRIRFRCKVCHSDVGFTMKAGADDITMGAIFEGEWCGRCHNGKIAFAPFNCSRCHSLGRVVEDNHKINAELLKDLPGDAFGNGINWVKALQEGHIQPKASLDGTEEMVVFDRNIDFPVKASHPHPPDVVFPHKAHTQWLHCNNCHPYVFNMKAGGNPDLSMTKNFQGFYCGVCHDKVAFPLQDCFRCHSQDPKITKRQEFYLSDDKPAKDTEDDAEEK